MQNRGQTPSDGRIGQNGMSSPSPDATGTMTTPPSPAHTKVWSCSVC